jgi:hypothetical protein
MLVRRSRLESAERALASQQARHAVVVAQMQQAMDAARMERKEVRRLTNIIIELKQQGMQVARESLDESWGTYRLEDAEAIRAGQQKDRRRASEADDQLLAAIEAELI